MCENQERKQMSYGIRVFRKEFSLSWMKARQAAKLFKKCTGQQLIARPFWPEEALLSVFGLLERRSSNRFSAG
jgi:hypothetical protein